MWGIEAAKSLKELAILTANAVKKLHASISNNTENVSRVEDNLNLVMPVGTVLNFAGQHSPEGFLLCDGAEISRSKYPKLFNSIGTAFGAGDGVSTFNLPNFQGVVPRGAGTQDISGRTKDGGVLGTVLEDQMQRITGEASADGLTRPTTNTVNLYESGALSLPDSEGTVTRHSSNFSAGNSIRKMSFDSTDSPNARTSATTDGETRVSSLAVNFIIKY